MTFKNLELKQIYDSTYEDVFNAFFNKVLALSKLHVRVGGIFTADNLAACADGLQEFIKNDGKMELVFTAVLSEQDREAINNGVKDEEEIIAQNWITDFGKIKEKFQENQYKALAWMIAQKYLKIRIVLPTTDDGKVIDAKKLEGEQFFKRQTGVFWDADRDSISFSGDVDLASKVFGEYYHLHVYRSWLEEEGKSVQFHYQEFQKYWEGKRLEETESKHRYNLKTISLPRAIEEKLIQIAPKSKSEIDLQRLPSLRPYQEQAIANWVNNDRKGIFEMATGTGKTFTAIGCIKEVEKSEHKFLVVIVCPFDNLMRQWSKELSKWNIESIVTAGDPKWRQKLRDTIAILESKSENGFSVFVTSYAVFASSRFTELVEKCKVPIMLVADEVHHAGSNMQKNGLIDAYNFRLGLTATLERYFDPIGTSLLESYFGKTVFEFSLEEAINKDFLVKYYYYPIYTDLTRSEFAKYKRDSRRIATYWNSKKPEDREKLESALLVRSKTIRDASRKMEVFNDIISQDNNMKYTLIYCSERQILRVKRMLNQAQPKPIINREITAKNPSKIEERMQVLDDLAKGRYQAIVAIGVLDEGADVPEARNCILLASTGNPKQFVQRRGRVLRKFFGQYDDGSTKDFATIHDVLIIPDVPDSDDAVRRTELSIIRSQLRRQEEMARIAINSEQCLKEIKRIKRRFGIEERIYL